MHSVCTRWSTRRSWCSGLASTKAPFFSGCPVGPAALSAVAVWSWLSCWCCPAGTRRVRSRFRALPSAALRGLLQVRTQRAAAAGSRDSSAELGVPRPGPPSSIYSRGGSSGWRGVASGWAGGCRSRAPPRGACSGAALLWGPRAGRGWASSQTQESPSGQRLPGVEVPHLQAGPVAVGSWTSVSSGACVAEHGVLRLGACTAPDTGLHGRGACAPASPRAAAPAPGAPRPSPAGRSGGSGGRGSSQGT